MGPRDDPEASWVIFEQVTAAAHWPPEHGATLIAPYLTGPAQAAFKGLDPIEALDYIKVKAAILDYMDINPDLFHLPQGHRPERAGCWSWLNQRYRLEFRWQKTSCWSSLSRFFQPADETD